jgi:hypothetical protein
MSNLISNSETLANPIIETPLFNLDDDSEIVVLARKLGFRYSLDYVYGKGIAIMQERESWDKDEHIDAILSGMFHIQNTALLIDTPYHPAALNTEVRYFQDHEDFKKWVKDINIPHYAKFWIEE